MTGRLATQHSSTTVLISKILIHASVYQYNKYQSHKSTGRSKTKTTSNGGESMGSGALQTTIGLSLSTSTDICVSHQTRRLRCQVHTQLSSVSSLFCHTNAIYKYTHTFAHSYDPMSHWLSRPLYIYTNSWLFVERQNETWHTASGVTGGAEGGGSCPQAQQARGAKWPSQKSL